MITATASFMPLLRRLDLVRDAVAPSGRARLRQLPARATLHARAGSEMVRQKARGKRCPLGQPARPDGRVLFIAV